MKQFKALLQKEWRTHWLILLAPLFCTAGMYLVAGLGILLSLVKGNTIQFFTQSHGIPAGFASMMLYGTSFGATAILGTVGIIASIILADNMINGGYKRKCEILHLSQPVAFHKIVLAKYLLMMLGLAIQICLLSLFTSLMLSWAQHNLLHTQMYYGMIAWSQSFIEITLSMLFLGSLYWFFAGMFKSKSFIMGTLLIFAIQAAISLFNYTSGLHIPSLVGYLGKLASVQLDTSAMQLGKGGLSFIPFIESRWQQIFSGLSLLKIMYAIIFFLAGSLLYQKRELS